jgi:hypothetical protein
MRTILNVLAIVAAAWTVCLAKETLTNDSILELHKLGLGDAVIVEKIKTTTCNFDTSTAALKQLKEAGISDTVLAAMISGGGVKSVKEGGDPNDPLTPHATGIYVYQLEDGKPKMTPLGGSAVDRVRSGGHWGAAWGGTAKSRAVLSGLNADLQLTERRPTFYFYLSEGLESLAGSPNQFSLCELEQKKEKQERRLVIGKAGLGGSSFGVDSKSVRAFTSEKVANGIYKVIPSADLAPGEYAFVLPSGGSVGRMFDFAIK